ncbi:hypothetical protein [Bailinhaonella thermotolerans]|uniref:Uncharacterized protein n=1 Tax=Bailinhaonella thermotolerans TaxID=1070861 RepID=A0A3A4A9U8_9ACTN|nr:hypothetical protein [Bailinhaonella thermotolerans]RJL22106.1 hypothetical protein D5H75_36570 [Bailinhaonella thermotolerans]
MNLRAAFVAAPLLVLGYGVLRILDGLDGSRGPGPAWTLGHLSFLAALALFIPILLRMRRTAGAGGLTTAATVVSLVGVAALVAQFTVDIVGGFLSADHAELSRFFAEVKGLPVVPLAIYDVGPYLFYLGQIVLIGQLAAQRRVKGWTVALYVAYLVTPAISKDLIPVSAILLLAAFLPISAAIARTPTPAPAPART